MITYSIIIPHKNTPDLLQYCLDSIPVRDDVQVIVVDDNSDADKVDFDHFPQWKGEHYECYLTKEGKGAGYARNVGLKHVNGKWVLFVDADDFLLPSVNEIFDEEKDTDADMVFFRPKAVMLDAEDVPSKRADIYNAFIDGYLKTVEEVELRSQWFSPCSRFFRSSMIREKELVFEEIRYANDTVFAAMVGCEANKIAVRDKYYYTITESDNSLTSLYLSKQGELETRAEAFFRAQHILYEHHYPVNESFAFEMLRRLVTANRKVFVRCFKAMQKLCGYSRMELIKNLFATNRPMSRFKRSIYAFVVTV